MYDVSLNDFVNVETDLKSIVSITPSCVAFEYCTMIVLDCDRALQVWIPSYHVWWSFVLPAPPQFLNQEPPRPQQLLLPDFVAPHMGHTEIVIVVVVSAGVFMCIGQEREREREGGKCECDRVTGGEYFPTI